jgi:hypothetical protein
MVPTQRRISFDKWLEKFKPVPNHLNPTRGEYSEDDQSFTFETFGEDVEFVAKQDPRKVWTILDCDGKEYIGEGFHRVNRVGYFVTEVPFDEGDTYSIKFR